MLWAFFADLGKTHDRVKPGTVIAHSDLNGGQNGSQTP
jgi:hypothetical protein